MGLSIFNPMKKQGDDGTVGLVGLLLFAISSSNHKNFYLLSIHRFKSQIFLSFTFPTLWLSSRALIFFPKLPLVRILFSGLNCYNLPDVSKI